MSDPQEKPVDLKTLIRESQDAMLLARREGREVMITIGEWAVGHAPEAGMYKVDPMWWYTGMPDPTSDEQYVCKSLSDPMAPVGTGATREMALEKFVFNQSMGEETRISADFTLPTPR